MGEGEEEAPTTGKAKYKLSLEDMEDDSEDE